jgi:hypothetical protein
MALGIIDRIKALAVAKARTVSARDQIAVVQVNLLADFPGAATTINNAYNPLISAFATTIAALQTALDATIPVNADKVAFSDAEEAKARAGNV